MRIFGFNAATRNVRGLGRGGQSERQWPRGGAGSRAFTTKDALQRTSRTNDNALQEAAAMAYCVCHPHPALPRPLFAAAELIACPRVLLALTRLSSNYLCGRCLLGGQEVGGGWWLLGVRVAS